MKAEKNLPCIQAGFTLIELLVVAAVIAILLSLVGPALQGLAGTSGRRGGLNTATAVLEHARLSAIESGATTYVGFPTNALNRTNGYSHIIVFREPRPFDTNTNRVAVTRWQRLPAGVFYEFPSTNVLTERAVNSRALPRLGNEDLTNLATIAFNRFGQLQGTSTNLVLRIGEKIEPGGAGWRGGGNNFFELTIHPLTGRTAVRDAALPLPVR